MTEILSQEEIDALVDAIGKNSDITEEDWDSLDQPIKVKLFNFKHPHSLTKKDLDFLHKNVSDKFCKIINERLEKTEDRIYSASIDPLTFEEFYRSLPNPTNIYTFKYKEIDLEIIFETFRNQSIIELFESIYHTIFTEIFDSLLKLQGGFETPELKKFQNSSKIVTDLENEDLIVYFSFIFKWFDKSKEEEQEDLVCFVIPYKFIRNYLQDSSQGHLTMDQEKTVNLTDINLDVQVVIGKTKLPLKVIQELGRGSVITLDQLINQPVDIQINGISKFKGELLTINDNIGVRIE